MIELKIPEVAYILGEATFRETWGSPDEFIPAILDACAPLIVAAELRRLAKEQLKTHDDISCMSLLQRADELDPQGATE